MKKHCLGLFKWIVTCLFFAGSLMARAGNFTDLHDFDDNLPDGAAPTGVILNNGVVYGPTAQGGGVDLGLVFTVATNGANFSSVHDFGDGSAPNELLLAGGTFFGTTDFGGANSYGLIYSMNANGSGYNVMYNFTNSPDAQYPWGGLTLGGATLYGTTSQGGTNGAGTVFKIDTNGANYTVLYSFANTPDGAYPQGRLLLNGATLYGTTRAGGNTNCGTVFKLSTNGTGYSVIYNFSNAPAAASPIVGLVLAGNLLYGASEGGGISNSGAVFQLGTNGAGFTIIHSFMNTDGHSPQSPLTLNNNLLYGSTLSGGTGGGGTVFQIATNGANFTVLKNFTITNAVTGVNPKGQLALDGNAIYGTANYSGPGGRGLAFRLVPVPVITAQPQGLTAPTGTTASFTVAASDEFPLSYQWYFNTTALLAGQVSSTLNLTDVTNGNAGNYTVVVTDNAGSVTSSPALLTVADLPVITAQPQNVSTTNGGSALFSVTATSNDGTPSYQWYFNTNNLLGGQTGATLALANVNNGNAGAYTVAVANNAGSVTSSPAVLTVAAVSQPPTINTQPQSQMVTNGNPATFSVSAATTVGTLTYQWYFNTNNLLAGQTGSSFTIPATTNSSAGAYTVAVGNGFGSITSAPAVLTIVSPPPVITAQPQSLTVTNGNAATFTVSATSAASALTYQWYFNTNNLIAGQTNNAYTIPLVLSNNAGAYSAVIGNAFGSVTSTAAILTFSINSKPVITDQTPSQMVTNGDTATFAVTASGQPTLRYQWYTNGVNTSIGTPLIGRTNNFFSFTTSTNYHYYFTVTVTNNLGKATSSPALLTIISSPVIASNPQPATVALGSPADFTVTAYGASLHYQWYSNTVNTAIGTLLAGQTSNTYSFTAITDSNGKYYSVVVTNTYGRATSSPALLTVTTLPYITLQPLPGLVTNGSSLTFTSGAAGPGPLSYQWLFQTNQLVAGATNTTLTVTDTNSPGYYSMKVTNVYGAATSSPALLTILSLPYITLQPLGATITNGGSVTFTSAAAGQGTLAYQWLFQTNLLIPGATSTSLTFATANLPGAYAMKVTNLYGAATSSPALLTVLGRPLLLSSAFNPANGSYGFTYVNLAGSTNRLWATTNLANPAAWLVIATNYMATNGLWQITDTNTAQTNTMRFYQFSSP